MTLIHGRNYQLMMKVQNNWLINIFFGKGNLMERSLTKEKSSNK
jgi:hypothetical protein